MYPMQTYLKLSFLAATLKSKLLTSNRQYLVYIFCPKSVKVKHFLLTSITICTKLDLYKIFKNEVTCFLLQFKRDRQ